MIIPKTTSSGVFVKDILNDSFGEMNLTQKYATMIYCMGLYLKLLVFPHPLTWDYYPYHISIMEWSDFTVLLSFVIYLLLIYFAIKGLKSKKLYSWCIFIFLIPLSLTSNFLFAIGTFMSERFLYAASIGFTTIVAYLIVVKPNVFFKTLFSRPYILLIPVLFLFSFKTITRNKAWKDSSTLVETDVKTSSNSAKSNALYGNDLYIKAENSKDQNEKAKYYELAFQHCEKAFKINPQMQMVNFILGTIYGKYKNDLNKSIYYLDNAMNLDPNDIKSYNNLGIAYGIANKFDKAIEVFKNALKIAPRDTSVISNLVAAYNFIGKPQIAEEYSKKILEIRVRKAELKN
jgi:protein O-mannosyl-transferase